MRRLLGIIASVVLPFAILVVLLGLAPVLAAGNQSSEFSVPPATEAPPPQPVSEWEGTSGSIFDNFHEVNAEGRDESKTNADNRSEAEMQRDSQAARSSQMLDEQNEKADTVKAFTGPRYRPAPGTESAPVLPTQYRPLKVSQRPTGAQLLSPQAPLDEDLVITLTLLNRNTNTGLSSTFIYTNTGIYTSTISLAYFWPNGEYQHTGTDVLVPGEARNKYLGSELSIPDAFVGYVVITSDQLVSGQILTPDYGMISGIVYEGDGVTPLPGMGIGVNTWPNGNGLGGTGTLGDGQYYYGGLPDGDFMVHAGGNDQWAKQWYNGRSRSQDADPVTLSGGSALSGINFIMQPGGIITGTVTDQDTGLPLANINVDLEQGWFGTCTDADGHYTIRGVPYGSHIVHAASSNNWCTGDQSVYIREYYNNVLRLDQASMVPVNAGDPVAENIDFTLEEGASIHGRVTDASSGLGLSNVRVQANVYSDGWYNSDGWTDPDGYYTIQGLVAETYRVAIDDPNNSPPGYARQYYDHRLYHHTADPVAVSSGATVTGINFELQPGGWIRGTVTDQDTGLPIANMNVDLGDGGFGTCTDANGEYLLWGVPYGEHTVVAAPDSNWCGGGPNNYVQEFYNQVTNPGQATPIPIDAAHPNAQNIDFTLETGGTIHGRVTDAATGLGLADIHVQASEYDNNSFRRWIWTDADGYYTIPGLLDGDYRLAVDDSGSIPLGYAMEYYNNHPAHHEADRVTLSGHGTLNNIDFSLEPGGAVTGTIIDQVSGQPLANINVGANQRDGGPGAGGCTDVNGVYTIYGLPYGDYEVSGGGGWNYCQNQANEYAREYFEETSHYYEATLIHINSAPPVGDIDFSLVKGGFIAGHVQDEQGDPVANLRVVAQQPSPDCPWCTEWIESTDTDDEGNYVIGPLAPDSYAVYACTDCSNILLVSEFYNDVYDIRDATMVPVTSEATTSNIDLTLEHGIWLTGTVSVPPGYSPADLQIDAWAWDSFYGTGRRTDALGNYIIPVPPMYDHYWAVAARPWDTDLGAQWAHGFNLSRHTEWDFDLGPGGTIGGCITDTNGPVAGVWVNADSDWMGQGSQTGSDGCFAITNLPAGDYRLRADQTSDHKYAYYGGSDWDWAKPIHLDTGEIVSNADIVQPLLGQFQGHVYESDGITPIPDTHVLAMNESGYWQAWTQTDGYYSIDLPAGDYILLYEKFSTGEYESRFYPSGHWYQDAQAMTVPPVPGSLTIDINLNRAVTIRGRVTDAATGDPLPSVYVGAHPTSGTEEEFAWWAFTDENGNYAITNNSVIAEPMTILASGKFTYPPHGEVTTTRTPVPGEELIVDFTLAPAPAPDGRFTILTNQSFDLTPFSSGGSLYLTDADQVLPALFTPLAQLNDAGEWTSEMLEQLPTLANGGAAVVGDQLVVTYTLKAGLLWSDGAPLTSADILYTWQALTTPRPYFDTYLAQMDLLWKIEGIETPGPLTAVLTYRPEEFPPDYLGAFLYLLPEHVLVGTPVMDIPWGSHYAHYPVGNGPYVVEDWRPGSHVDLRANPNYHKRSQGLPAIPEVRFQFNDHPFWSLLYGGTHVSLNIGSQSLPPNPDSFGLNLQQIASFGYEHIVLNPGLPFFQDVQVRKALAHAMNQTAMVAVAEGVSPGIASDTYLPPDHPMYSPAHASYDYSLTQAASLLTAAGWVDSNANGIRDKDGVEFEFDVYYREGQDFRRDELAIFQADLATIGVDANIVEVPWDTYWQVGKRGERDAYIAQWGFDGRFEPKAYDIFHSRSFPTAYNTYNPWGLSAWQNTTNDGLLEAARTELDAATLKDLYAQHLANWSEYIPSLVTRNFARLDAARPTVLNFTPGGNIPSTWNLEYWQLPPNPYDLGVRKAMAPDSPAPRPGEIILYDISVFNSGYFTMTGAVLLDTLPGNVIYQNAQPAPTTVDGNKLYWNLGDFPRNSQITVHLSVQIPLTVTHGSQITNRVQVYADQTDTHPANDAFQHQVEVREDVDLALTKYGVGNPAVGEHFNYYINYANWGGAPAPNPVITDTLPPEVSFLSADPPPDAINGQNLAWTVPTVPGNQWGGQIRLRTEIVDSGQVTNQAEVDSSATESNTANNEDDHTETVDEILAPIILRPTAGTTDGTPTVLGLAPSDSMVSLYDLSALQAAAIRRGVKALDATLIATTTATSEGTFSLEVSLTPGTHILAATSSKAGLTSGYSNTTTIVVVLNIPLDPDHVTIRAHGVDISAGSVRSERRALAYTSLDLSAILACPSAPVASLDITENGLFNYTIPPLSTTSVSPGNWQVEFRAWLGDPRSSYNIWIRWTCEGQDKEELLIYILIDPDGYLYDQSLVDSGALITDSLLLNGVITAYVKTGDNWQVWPAGLYGQTNPQSTDGVTDDGILIPGYYSFLTPGGQYRIEAYAPGYQPYESPVLTVITSPIHLDIGLLPVVGGTGMPLAPANLNNSRMEVDHTTAFRGDEIIYDIYLTNSGDEPTGELSLEYPIPENLSFVNGSLSWSGGNAQYDPVGGNIQWSGTVPATTEVHIQFRLMVTGRFYVSQSAGGTAIVSGAPEYLQSLPELSATVTLDPGYLIRLPCIVK